MALSRRNSRPRALESRWRKLPAASREILAAVLWHDGTLRDAWLAELAADPEAVDPLLANGWLREESAGNWGLHPALDRQMLRSWVPWSVRRKAHLALGRVLGREPAHLAAAAAHLAAGGLPDQAGRTWLAAARGHCRRNRHRLAAECFAQAIACFPAGLPDEELLQAVRDFATCAGLQRSTTTAVELLQAWRELPLLAERTAFQAEAARTQADALARAGRHVEAARVRGAAAECFARLGASGEAAAELAAAATTLAYALHIGPAEELAARAQAAARSAGRSDLLAEASILRGFCLGMRGETDAGRAQVEAGLDIALAAGLTAHAADAYRILGNVREYASCYHDVPEAFARALSYCRRHGQTETADLCVGCLSYSLFRAGSWRRSANVARRVTASRRSPLASRCVAWWVQGFLQAHRGEFKPARRHLAWSHEAARQLGLASMQLLCLAGEALVHELTGEPDGAAAAYRRLMDLWMTTEDRHDAVPGLTGAVMFFASRAEVAATAEFASALQRIAAANPNPENRGAAALGAAELKLLEDRPGEAAESFNEALRHYEQRGLGVEMLRARLRLGAAYQQAGDASRAAAAWREARAQANRLGARPLAARAAAGLARVAAPSQPPDSDVWQTLSPRQREVARHLAAGRTNKEIAGALTLSVRTVDMHVAHLLARLDCRTRAAAAARLAGAVMN